MDKIYHKPLPGGADPRQDLARAPVQGAKNSDRAQKDRMLRKLAMTFESSTLGSGKQTSRCLSLVLVQRFQRLVNQKCRPDTSFQKTQNAHPERGGCADKVHSRANKPQPVKRTGFMHTHLSVSGCAFSLNIDFHDALPFLPKNIVEIYSNSDGKQEITYRSGSLVQAVSHSRAVRIK